MATIYNSFGTEVGTITPVGEGAEICRLLTKIGSVTVVGGSATIYLGSNKVGWIALDSGSIYVGAPSQCVGYVDEHGGIHDSFSRSVGYVSPFPEYMYEDPYVNVYYDRGRAGAAAILLGIIKVKELYPI